MSAITRKCACCGGDPDTVCDACGEHACWAGRFMCEDAATAGTRQMYAELVKASAPPNWPARFRAAAEVASREGFDALAAHLGEAAEYLQLPGRVEAVGRSLLGEAPR